jgi:aspartokinase-like uncharacterized kinase
LVFDPYEFLLKDEPELPGSRLPTGWHVTSDSIAARVGMIINADEVVLLKSTDPPSPCIRQMAKAGYVDDYLPHLATALTRLRLENLLTKGVRHLYKSLGV